MNDCQCLHQVRVRVATVQKKIIASHSRRQAFLLASGELLGTPGQRQARWLLGAPLALCLAVGGLQVLVSYAARDFMTALANRDTAAFYHNLWRYLASLSWQYR